MVRLTQTGVVDPGAPAVGFLDAAHAAADNTPPDAKAVAKQISDSIDAALAAELARIKANKEAGDIGLLLLGQSESGKSTLLKQFRMMHSIELFESERQTWRPVILLNVFNTVRNVLSVAREACERNDPESSYIDRHLLRQVEDQRPEFAACEEKLVRMLVRSGHVQSSVSLGASSQKVLMRRQEADRGSGFRLLTSTDIRELDAIGKVLDQMQDQLIALWRDQGVQKLVKQRLQEDWRE
jgi:guanine nucleotide-binding protein subunit alpha